MALYLIEHAANINGEWLEATRASPRQLLVDDDYPPEPDWEPLDASAAARLGVSCRRMGELLGLTTTDRRRTRGWLVSGRWTGTVPAPAQDRSVAAGRESFSERLASAVIAYQAVDSEDDAAFLRELVDRHLGLHETAHRRAVA